jgi:hypothetical protein
MGSVAGFVDSAVGCVEWSLLHTDIASSLLVVD